MPTELTVSQLAAAWGVSTQLIYRWIQQGRLKTRRLGSITLIDSRAKRPTPRRPARRQEQ